MNAEQNETAVADNAVEGGLAEPEEPTPGSLDLMAPEDEHTRADWEAATATVLRKARRLGEDDPDDLVWARLTTQSLDGIDVLPLGTPDLIESLQTAGRPTREGAWDIRAHVDAVSSPAKALNEAVLVDLDGGVTSLWVRADATTDLAAVLDGVFLDLAPAVLDAGADALGVAQAFLSYVDGAELHVGTNLGAPAHGPGSEALTEIAALATRAGVLGVVVDATTVHDRGGSDVQELAFSLALGVAALRTLSAAGVDVAEAAGLVEFRYAATDDQFATIAKLRAARRLWARVLELSGVDESQRDQRQHVVTSRPMASKYDPYVNMLRGTVAAFAGGVGGAESITVLPFDTPLGQPEALGRRIARNTSALLISESHVARVSDPAGGSYAVEKMTDDVAVAAWAEFARLEDEGGPDSEAFDERIAAVVERREGEIATRTRPITGLTEFPDLAEELPSREPVVGEQPRRYGASFEALRDEPAPAAVFLATLGPVAQHTARTTFASNLFAAGGVAVEVAGATGDVEELVAAYDDQPVVCLAGSDSAYSERGEAAAAALREAGARWVIIAGKPTDYADDSAAMGVDALDFLTRTREKLS